MKRFLAINGQKLCEYADLRFGWRRFAENGCGVLAIYNALGLLGRAPCFSELFRFFHAWYRPRLFGVLPHQMKRYFSKQCIPVKELRSEAELEDLLKIGNVAVLTYWNRRLFGKRIPNIFCGAHSVALCFDGRFTVYNRYSNRNCTYSYDRLDELLSEKVFIKGFCLPTQL